MKQTERIERMEGYLDTASAAVAEMSEAAEKYEKAQTALKKLSGYYGSTLWMKDYEDDENGKLPPDLKRGVLSEDAVYNLLDDNRELMLKMLKILTKAMEGGVF